MPLSIWSPAWARKPELLLIRPILMVWAEADRALPIVSNAPSATPVSTVRAIIVSSQERCVAREGAFSIPKSIASKPRARQCDLPSACGLLANHRIADAEGFGIEQHECGPRDLLAAIDPAVIGAALDQHVAGLELHRGLIHVHVELAHHDDDVVDGFGAVHAAGIPGREGDHCEAGAVFGGRGAELARAAIL